MSEANYSDLHPTSLLKSTVLHKANLLQTPVTNTEVPRATLTLTNSLHIWGFLYPLEFDNSQNSGKYRARLYNLLEGYKSEPAEQRGS